MLWRSATALAPVLLGSMLLGGPSPVAAQVFGNEREPIGVPEVVETAGTRGDTDSRLISARRLAVGSVALTGEWRFRLGDNASWALPTYDDVGWSELAPSEPLADSLVAQARQIEAEGRPAVAWFRIRLQPERSLIRKPLALRFHTHGAATVYLDGRKILELGEHDVAGDQARIETALLPAPILFDSGQAVLAVRYHLGSAVDIRRNFLQKDLFHATVLPGEAIATAAEERRYVGGLLLGLTGLFLAIGLLHFALFVLLRHPVSNLHYAAFAGQFALFPLSRYLAAGTGSVRASLLMTHLGTVAAGLALLALLMFLYTSFYERTPRTAIPLVVLTIFWMVSPFLVTSELTRAALWLTVMAFAVEACRVIAVALYRRKEGARTIGAGFLATFGILFYLGLAHFGVVPDGSSNLFWYAWLGVALSPSFHLASSFAATSKGLAVLSEHLEAQVADRTEALEEARVAAEAANRTKSQFLANMSHELRTPLNAIMGYSEMLVEEAEDVGQEQFVPDLRKIHGAGKHLLGLINDILDLSKIEAGRMELYLERFEVESLATEVATTIRPLIEKNRNVLDLRVDPATGVMRGDLVKVRQILFNLLSNASKFTEDGTITLAVRPSGDSIVFSVEDTGIGMTPAQQAKLFEAFSQADASTTKNYGGTGLGLAISKRFVEMMGGAIVVDSEAGRGTRFDVTLPREAGRRAGAGDHSRPDGEAPSEAEPTAPTVLIIDDDPSARDVLSRTIGRDGYRVLTAADGAEGLRIAAECKPDLITLDILMQEVDGWSVLSQLKSDPELRDVPVVVVSILDDRQLGFALGASDYLTKPVERDRLLEVLRRLHPVGPDGYALVVEDDPATREMLCRLLGKEGWLVQQAENGRVALDRVRSAMPAVVLLDLMMPEMDGFTFAEEFRREPDSDGIGVVVLTAKDLTDEERHRLRGSVSAVLQKGEQSNEDVLSEIRRLLRDRRPTTHATP